MIPSFDNVIGQRQEWLRDGNRSKMAVSQAWTSEPFRIWLIIYTRPAVIIQGNVVS